MKIDVAIWDIEKGISKWLNRAVGPPIADANSYVVAERMKISIIKFLMIKSRPTNSKFCVQSSTRSDC
jgi:hypothetical protein